MLSCTEVAYEKREDTHGVAYYDASNMYQWTPVVGKRRTPLPDYMLRRFPPHCRQELQTISSDSESSESDQPLQIPEKASMKFAVCDGKPGLQVRTRNTSNWTPIASKTRAKRNRVVTHSRVHACISHQLFKSSVVQYIVQELL